MISTIFKDLIFSEEDKIKIETSLEKFDLKKGALLLKEGDQNNYQYYVEKGCLRTFYLDNLGKEHTLQFAINDWWIGDYTSFFTSSKAILHIECIQDATLCRISKSSLDQLYTEVPSIETFFRKKMEGAFASFQKRILASLAQPATERYLSFIEHYPNIEQNVKNYHIASFLGITTESLSRIRKELSSK